MSEKNQDDLYSGLSKLFHEPRRLAIVSALCAAPHGLSFRKLKDECCLTDGNLNRHLKTLEDKGVIVIEKKERGGRSCTQVYLTPMGRHEFIDYLQSLEGVLLRGIEAVEPLASDKTSPWHLHLSPTKAKPL